MKVSTATIRLMLRTSKVLADGSHPIYLRVNYNGMKEVSCGYSCVPKYWDKKNECIKKGFPNYQSINAVIQKMKSDAIERRNKFELNGIAYTPSMILEKDEIVSQDDFKGLIAKYTVALSPTTKKVWKSFQNSFLGYKKVDKIQEVTLEVCKGYAKHLEDSGMKESTVKMTLSKLAALCKFGVEEGIIKESPFKRFNINKKYKTSSKNVYIHHRSIEVMKEMFLNDVIVSEGKMWHYKDDVVDRLIDRTSDLFARYFWLCGLLFQGLAPIDLCQLEVKDLVIKDINGEDYYCYDGKRQKTKVKVKIRIKAHTMYSNVMIKTMLMFRSGKYFLPILDGVVDDRLVIYKKVSNWLSNHIDKFRDWVKVVNAEIIQRNVTNKDDIPLIPEDISYYSYRHSYAQMYLAKGGSPLALASLLGRSVDTISTYIEELSEESDLVESVSIVE